MDSQTQNPLTATNVAGPFVRDLIEALKLLHQDARHNIDRVEIDNHALRIHLFTR